MVSHKILILFLALLPWTVRAQRGDFNFLNFTSKDGLSSNTVNAVLKDRFGYMWFATDEGLNRFDGVGFTVYGPDPADSTSLSGRVVLALHEDHSGNLWVGTNRGLSLYDRQRNIFRNFNVTRGAVVRAMCTDHAGNLWVGSYAGVTKLNPVTGQTKFYSAGRGEGQLVSNTVISIFEDSQHRLWVGTNAGLHLYQPVTDNFCLFSGEGRDSVLSDPVIKAIFEDRDGRLWLGTSDGGLNVLMPGARGVKCFKNGSARNTLSSNRIYCIAQDDSGSLWLGTEAGLDIFDPGTGSVRRVQGDIRSRYSLKGKSVRSIYIDRNGIYWVGTYQSGVNKYDRNLTFFNLVQSNPFDPFGLSSPKVTSFAEKSREELYVGTDGGGLNLYDRRTGLFRHLSVGGGNHSPLTVMVLERVGNELWIGTYLQGIYVLNTVNGSVRHYTQDAGPSGLSSNDIFCIHGDKHGNVWIGTNGKGVDIYRPESRTFQRIDQFIVKAPDHIPLGNAFVRSIVEDSARNIWIGVLGRGVILVENEGKSLRLFNGWKTGLPLSDVQTILPGKGGEMWVGTTGSGLCRVDYRNDRYTAYGVAQGLPNLSIYKILEDDSGKIWVSTNKGLSCLDTARSTFKNYTADNGLQGSPFNLGAGLKTGSGDLFFGGLDGFNYFSPPELNYDRNIPAVVFTGLKIANKSVIPGRGGDIGEHISVAKEIRLDFKQNFSVDFAALDFTSPHECQYLYKLEGFDKTWNFIGNSRTAVFTNLDPGRYTLSVKAHNPNDGWTTEPATIAIYVKPPFWRTATAYVLYVVIAVLVLWGARYRAIRRLKQKFAAEQEREQVRKMIEDERKEAERQREFDQSKIKFLTNLSHEFRTPISLIMGPVETLLDIETDKEKTGQLSMVKRNARRLLNLANQLLDFRKLEERELRLNATPGDIVAFVRDVSESFRDLADRRRIRYSFNSSLASYYTAFDKDKIERILFNLLSNAFKFTGSDGQVSLEIGQAPDSQETIISVADTGIGISQEEQQRIFEPFFQGESHPSVMNQGTGIGLSICREFVRLHGGRIQVGSARDRGSVFTVRLPLEELAEPALTGSGPASAHIADEGLAGVGAQGGEDGGILRIGAEVVGAMGGEPLTVLLIEDNEDFRAYLKNNLKPYYKVIEAADGREGWQKVLSGHPQVIVSDINMPYMDGIELSNKIKADKRTCHIPIILLTALAGGAHELKGLKTGASDYLTKPFSWEILQVKIRNLILLNQHLRETYSRRLNVVPMQVEAQSEGEKLLLAITRFIEENLHNDQLSVEELSRQVFMSRGTLYNKIVELTGETPVEYIRSVRLKKAAELLENSDMKIAQIGYAVGFATPNYFTRAFKVKYNMLPSEYAARKGRKAG